MVGDGSNHNIYMVMVSADFPFCRDWGWIYGWGFVITTTINLGFSYRIINNKNPRVLLRNRSKTKKVATTDDTQLARLLIVHLSTHVNRIFWNSDCADETCPWTVNFWWFRYALLCP